MFAEVLRFFPYILFPAIVIVVAQNELTEEISNDGSGGRPMGMQPYCPGVTKPSSVTNDYLFKHYSVVVQNGWHKRKSMYRKRYFYKTAANDITNDENVDFRNKKTMVFLSEAPLYTNMGAGYQASRVFSKIGYNAISINTQGFKHPRYPVTARLARLVGNVTAILLRDLMERGLDPADIVLVGGSLGAHMAGFTGKYFYQLTGKKIGHIMAIDPSGLCFRYAAPEDRLDSTDADFVQAIHANMYGFGMEAPIGHVDFYLNGGLYQNSWYVPLPCLSICSHIKAYEVFYYIIKYPGKFRAMKCNSIKDAKKADCLKNGPMIENIAGLEIDKNITGIFYLPAFHTKPYYLPGDISGDLTLNFLRRLNKNGTLVIDSDTTFGYDFTTDVPPKIIEMYEKDNVAFKERKKFVPNALEQLFGGLLG